jgi:hypothetical protein
MLAWGFHNIFIVHGTHIDVGCTMVGLCGIKIMSQFFLHMTCVKSMALVLHGENQGFRCEVCNI